MRNPWWHRWRWLFALLVGVGMWWCVEWLVEPKEHFHLQYPNHPPHVPVKPSEVIEVPGERDVYYHEAYFFDRESRYLFVIQNRRHGAGRYEVHDFKTHTVVARYPIDEHCPLFGRDELSCLAGSEGVVYFVKNEFITNDYPRETRTITRGEVTIEVQDDPPVTIGAPPTRPELWEWNAFTNQSRKIHEFSKQSTLKFSHDGTTLLEIQRITPAVPTLLFPTRLDNILGGLTHMHLKCSDLSVMRVFSLPTLSLQFTTSLPWIERGDSATLSSDGRILIVPDSRTARGFVSPTRFHEVSKYWTIVFHAAYPLGVRVYDCPSGTLVWQSKPSARAFTECMAGNSVLLCRSATFGGSTFDVKQELAHLPTGKVRTILGTSGIEQLNETTMHYFDATGAGNTLFDVFTVDEQGNFNKAGCCDSSVQTMLPHTTQYITRQVSDSLKHKLAQWLHDYGHLKNWHPAVKMNISVIDYSYDRVIWRKPFDESVTINVTQHWLLLSYSNGGDYHLSVYALPFTSWSPWWSRAAGFLAAVLVWRLLRKRLRLGAEQVNDTKLSSLS